MRNTLTEYIILCTIVDIGSTTVHCYLISHRLMFIEFEADSYILVMSTLNGIYNV